MSANAFRSPLMQQIAAAARSHNRPPLVFSSRLSAKNTSPDRHPEYAEKNHPRASSSLATSMNDHSANKHVFPSTSSLESLPSLSHRIHSSIHSSSPQTVIGKGDDEPQTLPDENIETDPSFFQSTLQSRRTASNYMPIDLSRIPVLRSSMTRAVECAIHAPNHHRTEPTTYYKIVTNTDACNRLIHICYNVALCRNLKTKTKQEAQMNAESKMQKWKNTISGYIVVCVANQPLQDDEYPYKPLTLLDGTNLEDDASHFSYWYDTLPLHPPQTERQLEDYASACASIQNLMLSLHSEHWGSKWATGPIIRCRAMRSLIGCKENDAIAGIVMIGDPKVLPREWRRRRALDGDVMREL